MKPPGILRRYRSTHAQRLERWIGAGQVGAMQDSMRHWYGPPIAVHNVPGNVWIYPGGDIVGPIQGGAGFSSLSDLIAEVTSGNRRVWCYYAKGAIGGGVGGCHSLWKRAEVPAAGSDAAAPPGGTVFTSSSAGAFPFDNPPSGDTLHFAVAAAASTTAGITMLLYDRLFAVQKNMLTSSAESVTGVPTRYQSTTPTDMDYVGGNFLFPEVTVALSATAHNWVNCTYTDQGGAASTFPTWAGIQAQATRLDLPLNTWFAPLEAGDSGIKTLTQVQLSAALSSGGPADVVIGHPIAFMPCPLGTVVCFVDGLNTAFNLVRIFDDAALGLLDILRPTTGTPRYVGSFSMIRG